MIRLMSRFSNVLLAYGVYTIIVAIFQTVAGFDSYFWFNWISAISTLSVGLILRKMRI